MAHEHPPAPARITFAIPFYSGVPFLRRAIESVLGQEDSRWELLVRDDASPEPGIQEVVLSYGDDRIRYSRNETNLGMAGNWNRCLDLAGTELVTLLHADDELRPSYAGRMLDAAQRHPGAAAFFCNAEIIGPDHRRRFSLPDFIKRFLAPRGGRESLLAGPDALARLARGNFIICPTLCFRKRLLADRRFSPNWRFVLDLDFVVRLLAGGDHLVALPEYAFAYRRHAGNATVSYTHNLLRFEEEAAYLDALADLCDRRGWRRAGRIARRKGIVQLNLLYCIGADLLALRWAHAGAKLRLLGRIRKGRSAPAGGRPAGSGPGGLPAGPGGGPAR